MIHRFVDNNDGTITDNLTGLMWQKYTTPVKHSWKNAIHYCKNLEFVGYNDWRLPSIQELQSIVDYEQHNPAIYPVFSAESAWYWSSSTDASSAHNAWYVVFSYGYVDSHPKIKSYHVRAVRGRPWLYDF